MRHVHNYPTLCRHQVPEQCENKKTNNEGFFLMSVIKGNTGRSKCTEFKGRQTAPMAWRIERQGHGRQYCHQEEVYAGFSATGFSDHIVKDLSPFSCETEKPRLIFQCECSCCLSLDSYFSNIVIISDLSQICPDHLNTSRVNDGKTGQWSGGPC